MTTRNVYSRIEETFNDLVPVIIGPNFWYEELGYKFKDFELSSEDKIKARKTLLAVDPLNTGLNEAKIFENMVLIYIPSPREQKLFGITFSVKWWKSILKNYQKIVDLEPLYNHFFLKDDFIPGGWYLFKKEQCFNGIQVNEQIQAVFSVQDPELRIMDIRRFFIFLFLMNINGTSHCVDLHNIHFLTTTNDSWIAKKNGDGRFSFSLQKKNEIGCKSKANTSLGIACYRPLV